MTLSKTTFPFKFRFCECIGFPLQEHHCNLLLSNTPETTNQNLETTNQKDVLVQFDLLEKARGCRAGHEGLPALHCTAPLVVLCRLQPLWVVLVVTEEIGLHGRLVGHCRHKAHARDARPLGDLVHGGVDTTALPNVCNKHNNFAQNPEEQTDIYIRAALWE